MGKLAGQVVWITGAGRMRGIGAATARRIAEDGGDVVISAIRRAPELLPVHEQEAGWRGVESLAEEIRAIGRRALALDCDVTDTDAVNACVESAERELGPLTGLVNNAGVASEAGAAPIATMNDDLWYKTVDINLNGVYRCCKAAVRAMLAHGRGGAIVNLSSLAGRFGLPNYGGYCATKFGVIGLTQQLAAEVARDGIRVNCVCPGSIDSDMLDGTIARKAAAVGIGFDDFKSTYNHAIIPMGRRGASSELGAAIAFLLGPDASYITGQTINVDGGYRMD
jgi:NAD(P)-dependent dehydrogenase (short-subunit alcohol dehydrogenase family)